MKKILLTLATIASLLVPIGVYAAFNSQQLAPNPSSGNCLKTDGLNNSWSASCGSGGGGSGSGTWATTTSNVPNHLINYSLNNTDIVCIGGTATTTCKFYFDPSTLAKFTVPFWNTSSSTLASLYAFNATTTNLAIPGITSSLLKTNSLGQLIAAVSGTDYQPAGTYVLNIGPAGQLQSNATITLASSTTGTDFSITGSGNTLTWNLPTASASNRGLLSSADWTTFNNKGSVTGVTATYPIISSGGNAPVISTAISTSSLIQVGTTSIASITTLPNLSLPISQVTGDKLSTTSADYYINASSTIAHPAGGATGNVIQWDGTKWVSVATSTLGLGGSGGGSVTSVNASGGTTGLTFSGGPITTSGTLTLAGTLGVGNGGTGLTATGASSTVLTTDGTNPKWNKLATSQLTNDLGFLTSAVTSVTGTYPIASSGGNTPNITFNGLSTTSPWTNSNVAYVINGNTVSSVATSSASCTSASGITCAAFNVIGTGATLSLSGIPNTSLANSSISGVSLGGTLNSLSHDSTLSGTSYNGSATVSNWGLNLGNANTWTALQTFGNSSTTVASFSYASSTSWNGGGLTTCNGTNALGWSSGLFSCVAIPQGTVTSVATNNGLTGGTITTTGTIGLDITGLSTNAITSWNGSKLIATGTPSLYAGNFVATTSTASVLPYASTTAVSISGLTSGNCVQASTGGLLTTTGSACGSGGGTGYPFQLTGNATSTLTQFNGGLTSYASTTIGGGTQTTGLTVNGNEFIGNGTLLGQSVLGMSSSSPSFVQAYIQNTANTATSSANFVVNNNLSTNSTYYGEFGINSSAYNELGFSGQSGNDVFLSSSDSNLDLGTGSSTGPNNVNFLIGGQASTNLVARIGAAISFFTKILGIGTTTPTGAQVVIASSTAPQVIFTDGTGTNAGTFIRNTGGTTYIGTTTPSTNATSSIAAVQINSSGSAGLSIGTTTTTGILNLGQNPASTNASTTIVTGKLQFQGYNSAGTLSCTYAVGTSWVIQAGACNN